MKLKSKKLANWLINNKELFIGKVTYFIYGNSIEAIGFEEENLKDIFREKDLLTFSFEHDDHRFWIDENFRIENGKLIDVDEDSLWFDQDIELIIRNKKLENL